LLFCYCLSFWPCFTNCSCISQLSRWLHQYLLLWYMNFGQLSKKDLISEWAVVQLDNLPLIPLSLWLMICKL
jgi:hypothetical protein